MRRILASFLLLLAGCSPSPPPPRHLSRAPGHRFVSLAPNLTELLFAVGAGADVVAVTRNDHYPPQVQDLPQVGDIVVDYEKLLALHPDRVIVDGDLNRAQLPRLQQLGLSVLSLESSSLAGMKQALRVLGQASEHNAQADRVIQQVEDDERQARAVAATWTTHPSVFVEVDADPLVSCAEGTYVDEVIRVAGLRNVCAGRKDRYPRLNVEELLTLDPDLIVLTSGRVEDFVGRPGWKTLRAARSGHLYRMPEDLLVRPSPRLGQALQLLQRWARSL